MNFPSPSPGQARIFWLAVTGFAIALLLALVAALVWLCLKVIGLLSPVLWPLAIAGVIAYLLDPVVDLIEKRGVPRARAIICVFALAVVVVLALFGSVVPRLVVETRDLVSRVPAYVERVETRVQNWVNDPPNFLRSFLGKTNETAQVQLSDLTSTNVVPQTSLATNAPSSSLLADAFGSGRLQTATGWAATLLSKIGSWLFGQVGRVASWFGVLAGLALVPVYAFYFLLEKRGISSQWTDYLPVTRSSFKEEMVFVINSINNYLIAFFRGQVLVAVCDGILYGIGFAMVGLPYAVLIGAAAVFLTIIPFIGAIIVCATAIIIALVQFGDWLHPLLVLLVFGIVQMLEGLVISPKIMGGRVGLHPVTIIIAVMTGTTVMGGLLGGILAIPLTAALRVLMFRYVWKKPMKDGTEAGKAA